MIKIIVMLLTSLVVVFATIPGFAISPGAGQAQIRNNMQELKQNQERMKQMRQHHQEMQQQRSTEQPRSRQQQNQ